MRRLVTCADGVNIHAGKYNWDDPNHLILYMGMIMAFHRIQWQLPLSAANARIVAQRIKALRRLFAFLSVRYFIKHRKPWTTELRDMVRGKPHFLSWYLPCVAYVMLGYLLHFYDPLQDW